ncbi:hypothetical protein HYR65_03300 [Candidatus Azambacteria bacterium]|nr:hypothetical protein [Candidatus Azambacteria bacterium]
MSKKYFILISVIVILIAGAYFYFQIPNQRIASETKRINDSIEESKNNTKELLDKNVNNLVENLRQTQANAKSGKNDLAWGIHLINKDSENSFYEIFSTASDYAQARTKEMISLDKNVKFCRPLQESMDVVFAKGEGTINTDTSIILCFRHGYTDPRLININGSREISSLE